MVTGSIPVAFKNWFKRDSFLFSTTQSDTYLSWGDFASLFKLHYFCKFVVQISEWQVRCEGRSANGTKGTRVSEDDGGHLFYKTDMAFERRLTS